jgi:hypothetical protein
MTKTAAVPTHRRSERGVALAYFGILMLMFIGFAVIGIDVARLAFTASEVQSIADSAALAAIGDYATTNADPTVHTTTIVGDNTVDGRAGTINSGTTAGIELLEPGTYDWNTKAFTVGAWGDAGINAARAHGKGTVTNLLAAAIGVLNSSVHRTAIAAVGPACQEANPFPVALLESEVASFVDSPNCGNLPATQIFQVPGQNSCFTSLSSSPSSASGDINLIPKQCCKNQSVCGKGQSVSVSVGDTISLVNGQLDDLLKVINGCLQAQPPLQDFVVPVIPDGGCTQGGVVQYFARIHIAYVVSSGAAASKGIYVTAICRDDVTGSDPGCQHGGGGNALALVQ